jgi:alanyl aminopeptidase
VPLGKLPRDATPLHGDLLLRIDPAAEAFDGVATLRIRLQHTTDHVWLHGKALDVGTIEVTDAAGKVHAAKWKPEAAETEVARVVFDASLPAQEIRVRIAYRGTFRKQLEGLYKSTYAGAPYVISQMEPISARLVMPSFDEPSFKIPYDLTLEIPPGQVGVANTAQISRDVIADGWQRLRFKTTPPLPTYLVAVAVGPWDIVDGPPIAPSKYRTEAIPLRGIAPRGEGARLHDALDGTPAIVAALEEYFGYPYAFGKLDLLAAPDFSFGAMENPGLVVFRARLLLLDAKSPTELRRFSFIVDAHELAHQWFGDTVTMPWWDDIWLNEAFASWMEGKITHQLRPQYRPELDTVTSAIEVMEQDSLASARRIRQPIVDNGDIGQGFDGITYRKGSAVLGMFEQFLGESTFRNAIRAYVRKHEFANATADDLIDALATAGDQGDRFRAAMKSFLDQSGVPQVATELQCNDGKAVLKLAQQRYRPLGMGDTESRRWGIPMCVRVGRGTAVATQCTLFDTATGEFALDGGCPDWYLPNAEARGYFRYAMPPKELKRVAEAFDRLSDAERIGYADALDAGFRSGTAGVASVLDAMPAFARATTREVATAPFRTFGWIRQYLGDATTRASLDAFAAELYLPRVRELGYVRRATDTEDDTLLRADLVRFLAFEAYNGEVRAALLKQAKAVLDVSGDERLKFDAANTDLLGTVLGVAVEELGAPAIDALTHELERNSDPTLRTSMIGALGATRDPALGERVREYAVSAAVPVGEYERLLWVHLKRPENRTGYWTWFQRRYDDIVGRASPMSRGDVPELASYGWCTAAEAKQLRTFFASRVDALPGGKHGLARAADAIALCTALRERHDDGSLARWAKQHAAASPGR